MTIPVSPESAWAELDAAGKRRSLLRAAGEVFARDGLEAPMPAIAAAAGAGVGSVYRQFPSKQDLLAALVVERLEEVEGDALSALQVGDPPRQALVALLRAYAERQAADDLVGEAMACVSSHPDVERALVGTTIALESLLTAAKPEGLRADASTRDLRLVFAATRAANELEDGGWRRMFDLGMDALFQ
jgi:AcrR family transcriptional regulator